MTRVAWGLSGVPIGFMASRVRLEHTRIVMPLAGTEKPALRIWAASRSVARHVSVPGSEFDIATALTRTMFLRG
jgi:hypothetical protein